MLSLIHIWHQLVVAVDTVGAGLFDVEHLAPQGEDGLNLSLIHILGENDKVMVLARTDHDDEAQTESIEADTEDEPTAEQLAEMRCV